MSSIPNKGRAGSGGKVIEQLSARATGSREALQAIESKPKEHISTTIIERIANVRRGYLAWLALETAAITGKEPAIDSEADASWRAR